MLRGIDRIAAVAAGLATILVSGTSFAGSTPQARWSEPYVPLGANATTLAGAATQTFSNGYNFNLPGDFTLEFYGTNVPTYSGNPRFSLIRAHGAGGITFDGSGNFLSTFTLQPYATFSLPASCGWTENAPCNIPDGGMFPWWDLWWRNSASPLAGGISYEVDGEKPNRVVKIEWKNHTFGGCYDANSGVQILCSYARSYSFQLWFYESNGTDNSLVQFHYARPVDGNDWDGSHPGGAVSGYPFQPSGTFDNLSGIVGVMNYDGTDGDQLDCSPNCSHTDWPSDTTIMFGRPTKAELIMSPGVTSLTADADTATLSASSVIRNLGSTQANGVYYKLYMTRNATLDVASDRLLGESPGSYDLDVAGSPLGTDQVVAADTFNFARPADGYYHVCAFVDDRQTVDEAIEENNTPCTTGTYLVGLDLTGVVRKVPATAGPGDDLSVSIRVADAGTDPSGPFSYKLYLSANKKLDGNDKLIYTGNLDLTGGGVAPKGAFDDLLTITLPGDAIGNTENNVDRYLILSIDSENVVPEVDETNNTVVSATPIRIIKADLKAESATVSMPQGCYFGSPISTTVTLSNTGAARAKNFENAIVLSDNSVITGFDQAFALSPAACTLDEDCAGTLGAGATCDLGRGYCTKPCSTDSDCVNEVDGTSQGLSCFTPEAGDATCTNLVKPGGSTLLTLNGIIPTRDQNGTPLDDGQHDGNYFFGFVTDFFDSVNEGNEGNNTRTLGQFLCQKPAPDFVPVSMDIPDTAAAGEVVAIRRVVENSGNDGGTVSWKYYLSSNDIISTQDIELPFAQPGLGTASLDPRSTNDGTDLVVLPSYLADGAYYVGIVLNPPDSGGNRAVHELSYENNLLGAGKQMNVHAASLRIVTASLAPAILGTPYMEQIIAVGGAGDYDWTLPHPEELPHDMSLTPGGILSGVPTGNESLGSHAVHVRVASGAISVEGLLVLVVTPTTGPLSISTDFLPPGYVDVRYQLDLVASGGNPPYHWVVENPNSLPDGIVLKNSILSGTPTVADGMNTPGTPRFRVTDSRGQWTERDYSFPVLTRADLSIQTPRLTDGIVGNNYQQILRGAGGEPPYDFVVTGLPKGLTVSTKPPTTAVIEGTPSVAGQFDVTVSITDSLGQHASQVFRLTIIGQVLKIRTVGPLPDGKPGEDYEATLTASAAKVNWYLYAGDLPAGLTLDVAKGVISGTIDTSAASRAYPFVVRIDDGAGGEGFASFSIDLPAPLINLPEKIKPIGCSATGGSPSTLLLLVGATLLLRKRRS